MRAYVRAHHETVLNARLSWSELIKALHFYYLSSSIWEMCVILFCLFPRVHNFAVWNFGNRFPLFPVIYRYAHFWCGQPGHNFTHLDRCKLFSCCNCCFFTFFPFELGKTLNHLMYWSATGLLCCITIFRCIFIAVSIAASVFLFHIVWARSPTLFWTRGPLTTYVRSLAKTTILQWVWVLSKRFIFLNIFWALNAVTVLYIYICGFLMRPKCQKVDAFGNKPCKV